MQKVFGLYTNQYARFSIHIYTRCWFRQRFDRVWCAKESRRRRWIPQLAVAIHGQWLSHDRIGPGGMLRSTQPT